MTMKFIPSLLLIFLIGTIQAQNSIIYDNDFHKITVVINSKGTFIEKYDKKTITGNIGSIFNLRDNYRLGPSASTSLKNGIKTAINWIDLNKTHQKTFEKEICRFKVMKKYKFDSWGYDSSHAEDMTLMFFGKSNGSFELLLKIYSSYGNFLEFNDRELVTKFKEILDGRSANVEIDEIFKISEQIIAQKSEVDINKFIDKGKQHMQSKSFDNAIAEFNKALRIEPLNEVALVSKAICYMTSGDWEKAIDPCDKAIRVNSGQAVAYFVRGSAKMAVQISKNRKT